MTPHDKLLVNREKWTLQETFDFIVTNLIKQKYPSVSALGLCLYRDTNHNRKCALGWFLRDSEYISGFEGDGSDNVIDQLHLDLPTKTCDMLWRLQGVHDNKGSKVNAPTFKLSDFAKVATDFNLTLPKVEN